MATEDLSRIVAVPARLCVGPTDLSIPFPHGGTALGATRGLAFAPSYGFGEVPYECFGGEPGEVVYLGAKARLAAVLRGLDPDAVAAVFPNVVQGPPAKEPGQTIDYPGSVRPGAFRSGSAVALLASPEDDSAPGVYLPRAVPVVAPDALAAFQRGIFLELAVAFVALRRASDGRAWQVGPLRLVTL